MNDYGDLCDLSTCEIIRSATAKELSESLRAPLEGSIDVDGRKCFVMIPVISSNLWSRIGELASEAWVADDQKLFDACNKAQRDDALALATVVDALAHNDAQE